MKQLKNKRLSPAKEMAFIAVETALLIGGQLALYPVAGVEVVTVLLLCFSWVMGPRAGALSAVCFSLLRCALWGFYPSAVVLYLLYYPQFALLFGALGRVSDDVYAHFPVWAAASVNAVLLAVCALCIWCVVGDVLKISRLAVVLIKSLLGVIAALSAALAVALDVAVALSRRRGKNVNSGGDMPQLSAQNAANSAAKAGNGRLSGGSVVKVIIAASLAAVCTIFFTLLDDFISPAFLGYPLFSESWTVYFYGSFLALAPQTVCAIVTVSTLFLPLTSVFRRAAKI